MLTHFEREKLIWDCSLISTNETIALLALNAHVDAEGECWPGQQRLAGMCKFTDRTVRNVCSSLADKGVIIRNHRYKNGRRTSDKFKIDFSVLAPSAICDLPEPNSSSTPALPERDSANIPERDSGRLPERDSRDLSIPDLSSLNYPDSPFNSPKGEEREECVAEGEVRHQNQGGEIMMSAEPQKSIETAAQIEVITTTDNEPMKSEPVATSDKEEPSTGNTRKKKASNPADYTPEFLEFWKLYPRCTNKGQAFKAWQQKIKAGHEAQEIMDFLRHELSDRDSRLRREEKFVPHGGTWLNSEDWTNEGWRKKRAASGNAPNASGSNLMAEFQSFQQEAQRHGERIELVQSGGDLIRYCVIRPNGQRDRTQIFQSGTLNMYRQVWALAKVAS